MDEKRTVRFPVAAIFFAINACSALFVIAAYTIMNFVDLPYLPKVNVGASFYVTNAITFALGLVFSVLLFMKKIGMPLLIVRLLSVAYNVYAAVNTITNSSGKKQLLLNLISVLAIIAAYVLETAFIYFIMKDYDGKKGLLNKFWFIPSVLLLLSSIATTVILVLQTPDLSGINFFSSVFGSIAGSLFNIISHLLLCHWLAKPFVEET